MKRTRIALFLTLLTGCAGLIGVPDLTLEETPADGGTGVDGSGTLTDGRAQVDGTVTNPPDTGPGPITDATTDTAFYFDTGSDAPACNTQTDSNNCGRCGHSCGGTACVGGVCAATLLTSVGGANLRFIAEHGDFIYASTWYLDNGDKPGIYKIPKTGGTAVRLVSDENVEEIAVVGDTLYFIIDDARFDDAGFTGGLWSCDISPAAPAACTPKLIEIIEDPQSMAADTTSIYWLDRDDYHIRGRSVAAPIVPGLEDSGTIHEVGSIVFNNSFLFQMAADKDYLWTLNSDITNPPDPADHAFLQEYQTDGGGTVTERSRYTHGAAYPGQIALSPTAIYFAAYDYDTTLGGTVRRVSRPEAPTQKNCSYGNATDNVRPSGVYVDGTNLYWTNQGNFTDPYDNATIATCPQEGDCCTTPTILWKGAGEPAAITGDANNIYWVTYRSGEIYKAPKP